MATKKVSYKNLLKQAISEFDTSKTVEIKGPMLDPILSWDGDGELPIYKDAASILERYYFNEDTDDQVTVDDLEEMEYNEDGTEAKTDAEKHGEGTGTNQAGTSDASGIRGMEKDQEQDIAKEMRSVFENDDKDEDDEDKDEEDKDEEEMEEALRMFFSEQDDDTGHEEPDGDEDEDEDLDVDKGMKEGVFSEKESDDEDVPKSKEYTDEVTEDIENAVIEKLIDEMEDMDDAEVMSYTGDGVKPGMEAPDEKKASGPEEDTEGAGTEQAGTGTAAGQVPDRKDMHDQMVKPKNYASEDAGVGGGPLPAAQRSASGGDDGTDDDYAGDNADLEEAFAIFKEAIEDDEEPDGDEKDGDEEDMK
jgi:hypothetical protein